MAAGRFIVQYGDDARKVEVTATGGVTIEGGNAVKVTPIDSHAYEVSSGPNRTRVYAAGPPEACEVFVRGRVFRFDVTSEQQRRAAGAGLHGDQLVAPMPSTVVKVLVEVGQHVQRGDVLIKIEAMKMEMPVRAPHDGTVAAVHCREGELVQAGTRLLDVTPAEEGRHEP